ncbi:type III secretion system translocon subunit SctE [Pseudomonas sp. HK3]|jgi:hypothetical protein
MTTINPSYSGVNLNTQFEKLDFKNLKDLIGKISDILAIDTTGQSQSGKPQIEAPKEVRNYEIELSAIMSKIAETLKTSALDQMDKNQELQKVKFEKKMEEMLEWLEESRQAEKWGAFGRAMSYIGGALAIIGGALLIATGVGAGLGAALIVGGVIGITDQVLKDTGTLQGGIAGGISTLLEKAGMSEDAAKWLGMALYFVILIGASAGAGAAAGTTVGASVIANAGTKAASVASSAGSLAFRATSVVSATAAKVGSSASNTLVNTMQSLIKTMAASGNMTRTAITGTTTVAGLAGSGGNLGAGITESASLTHLASAQEIAAMIHEIGLSLQMRKEDLEEAMEYFLNAIARITNMISGKQEVAQAMVFIRTGA